MDFKNGLTKNGIKFGSYTGDVNLEFLARKLESAMGGNTPRSLEDEKRSYVFEKTDKGFDLRSPMGETIVSVTDVELTTDQMTKFMKAISNYSSTPSMVPKIPLPTRSNPVPAPNG